MVRKEILHVVWLSDEQQFAVFRKRPHLVVYDEFEFVYVVAYAFQHGSHRVVVGNGFFTYVFNAVGHLPVFHQPVCIFGNEACVFRNLFYQFQVLGIQSGRSLGRKTSCTLCTLSIKALW